MSAKRKDAFYFSHDSNAKDDPKIVLLIESLGLEGYGIYWVLVEILRDQEDFRYPMSLLGAIARKYNSTADKVKAVVINYALFQFASYFPGAVQKRQTTSAQFPRGLY